MKNNIVEFPEEIDFCPYCGRTNIIYEDEESITCDDCGRDFTIMTHE